MAKRWVRGPILSRLSQGDFNEKWWRKLLCSSSRLGLGEQQSCCSMVKIYSFSFSWKVGKRRRRRFIWGRKLFGETENPEDACMFILPEKNFDRFNFEPANHTQNNLQLSILPFSSGWGRQAIQLILLMRCQQEWGTCEDVSSDETTKKGGKRQRGSRIDGVKFVKSSSQKWHQQHQTRSKQTRLDQKGGKTNFQFFIRLNYTEREIEMSNVTEMNTRGSATFFFLLQNKTRKEMCNKFLLLSTYTIFSRARSFFSSSSSFSSSAFLLDSRFHLHKTRSLSTLFNFFFLLSLRSSLFRVFFLAAWATRRCWIIAQPGIMTRKSKLVWWSFGSAFQRTIFRDV